MTVNFLETVFLVIMFRALIPVWCITITYLTLLELFYESCQENHCDLKVASSQEKNENFASYYFKTNANNKCDIVLKCKSRKIKAQGVETLS